MQHLGSVSPRCTSSNCTLCEGIWHLLAFLDTSFQFQCLISGLCFRCRLLIGVCKLYLQLIASLFHLLSHRGNLAVVVR